MPPRLAAPLAALAFAAVLLAGCGGSPDDGSTSAESTRSETRASPGAGPADAPVGAVARSCDTDSASAGSLRATGVSCQQARRVMRRWRRTSACSSPAATSRSSCTTGSYRCLGARTDRGIAVSCSRPGRSLAFRAER